MTPTHELRIDSRPFDAIVAGDKRCEIRLNDREFKVGDLLKLRRQREHDRCFTGQVLVVRVTHIVTGYGLQPGYVAMSIEIENPKLVSDELSLG